MVKLSLLRLMIKHSPLWHHHPPQHHLLNTGTAPISSYGTPPRGAKGGPSSASSIASPHVTRSPTSSIWTSLGRTPNSRALPDAKSCPALETLLFLDCHLPQHRYLPQLGQPEDPISTIAEAVSGLPLGVLSMAVDLNLFKEEIAWKGEVGGKVRPLKVAWSSGSW